MAEQPRLRAPRSSKRSPPSWRSSGPQGPPATAAPPPPPPPPLPPAAAPVRIIAHCYQLMRKLGAGGFGEVYEAMDTRNGTFVAIKLEPVDAQHPQLVYEFSVMSELRRFTPGVPQAHFFCTDGAYNVLVMQRLGESVESYRSRQPGGVVPLREVVFIALQGLDRLRTCHTCGFVHRDIKPENLVFGTQPDGTVMLHLIDFGLTKRVVNMATGRHISHKTGKHLTGTPRYASLAAHGGQEQSRRDDVEALAYVLVFIVTGSLPWQGIVPTPPSYRAIQEVKERISAEELCAGLPRAFADTVHYARGLAFDAMPDYGLLTRMWAAAAEEVGGAQQPAAMSVPPIFKPRATAAPHAAPPPPPRPLSPLSPSMLPMPPARRPAAARKPKFDKRGLDEAVPPYGDSLLVQATLPKVATRHVTHQ